MARSRLLLLALTSIVGCSTSPNAPFNPQSSTSKSPDEPPQARTPRAEEPRQPIERTLLTETTLSSLCQGALHLEWTDRERRIVEVEAGNSAEECREPREKRVILREELASAEVGLEGLMLRYVLSANDGDVEGFRKMLPSAGSIPVTIVEPNGRTETKLARAAVSREKMSDIAVGLMDLQAMRCSGSTCDISAAGLDMVITWDLADKVLRGVRITQH